jgi:hypothetical protein
VHELEKQRKEWKSFRKGAGRHIKVTGKITRNSTGLQNRLDLGIDLGNI